MPQQLRVSRELDATGATLLGVGNPYIGAGKIYYVDYLLGSDGYAGTNPNYPLQQIQTAINKCRDGKNDYVFILASKDADDDAAVLFQESDGTALTRAHLIGISNPMATFGVVMRVDSETINCIDLNDGGGMYSEIAGISFGGGTTAKGGISVSQTIGTWIHHCVFGHSFCGDNPDYGILGADQTNNEGLQITDCTFWGEGDNGTGKLDADGIYMYSATPSKNVLIARNTFMSCPGIGIQGSYTGALILNNTFKLPSNTAGKAITLMSHSSGCWIDGNSANFGGTDAMSAEAYVDDASGGADANTWGLNYTGGALDFPA